MTIRDLAIYGPRAVAGTNTQERGIAALGASAASPVKNLRIHNVTIKFSGFYAVLLTYVDGFRITDCDLTDVGYAGIETRSAKGGVIAGNRIDNVLLGSGGNGYGIALTNVESDDRATYPPTTDVLVRSNRVSRVPWEGIDTHGGQRITIADNVVTECTTGIAVVPGDGDAQVTKFGPKNITVTGNVVDSKKTDGSARPGISFAGAPGATTSDPAVDYATGSIVGNTILGHGDQANADTSGGIYLRNASGVSVVGNSIIEPAPFGINLYNDVRGVSVVGNTITDPWSTSLTFPSAITTRGANITGSIVGNVARAGSKSATFLNVNGVYASGSGVSVNGIGNDFTAMSAPQAGAGGGIASRFTGIVEAGAQVRATGTQSLPALSFAADTDSGFYSLADGQIGVVSNGTRSLRFQTTGVLIEDGMNVSIGTGTGTKFGIGSTAKLGFYGATPVVRPTALTAANASTVDATYGTEEAAVINNLRTRLDELETKLRALGLLT